MEKEVIQSNKVPKKTPAMNNMASAGRANGASPIKNKDHKH